MSYELLVLDLDGTLTNSEKKISAPTKAAIMKLQKMGKHVVLASGRPTPGVVPLAKELSLRKYGSYILSFNGGHVINCKDNSVVYNKILDHKYIEPIYKIVKKAGVNIITYTDTEIISAFAPNEETKIEARINHLPVKQVFDFPSYVNFPINKLLITGDAKILESMEIKLKSLFQGEINIFRSEPYFIEIMPPKIDKAYSLSQLLNTIGLTKDQMICCGDGFNDLTMIQYAGLGVAMANAQQVVLDHADYITKSNDEDGIIPVIEKFMMDDSKKPTVSNIDLHCHLDGSLPLNIIEEILERPVDISELQVPHNCESLAEYLECFQLPLECMQTEEHLEQISYHFMKSLVADHVSYIEVRFAPMLSTLKGLTCKQVLDAVIRGLEKGKESYGIDFKIILCTMRHHSHFQNLEIIKLAQDYIASYVCAVDLAGNEAAFPMNRFRNLFFEASIRGIPFTIHAGECGSVENVIEAVELGARRIGHGIALSGHKEAIDLCKEKGVVLEMCPISNMQTKSVSDIKKYPLREFLEEGLLVTINTDNRMVSGTSLAQEYAFIQENFAITDEEIAQLKANAHNSRF